jgi:predicted RNA-binding protein with TRAM domain
VKGEATVSGRVGTVCTVPHANEGVTTPVKVAHVLSDYALINVVAKLAF